MHKKFEISNGSALKTVGILNIRLTCGNVDVYFSSVYGRDLVQQFRGKSINGLLQSEVELCTRVGLSSLVVSVEHVHSTVRHETVLLIV